MTRPMAETMDLARRAVSHYVNRSTDQAPSTYALDVSAYTDPDRYRYEVEKIFRELPLALVLSIEIREPNSYRATEVCGTPVIVTRDAEGVAHAFLNACRHRGAPVCANGRGQARQFSCPYHAWVYDTKGALVSKGARWRMPSAAAKASIPRMLNRLSAMRISRRPTPRFL